MDFCLSLELPSQFAGENSTCKMMPSLTSGQINEVFTPEVNRSLYAGGVKASLDCCEGQCLAGKTLPTKWKRVLLVSKTPSFSLRCGQAFTWCLVCYSCEAGAHLEQLCPIVDRVQHLEVRVTPASYVSGQQYSIVHETVVSIDFCQLYPFSGQYATIRGQVSTHLTHCLAGILQNTSSVVREAASASLQWPYSVS